MPSSLPPRALSFLMMSPVSLCRAAWHTAWVLRCIDLYRSLYRVVCRLPSGFFSFIPLMLTVWTYFLLPEKWQDPHCSTCIHLVRWNAWKLWRNFPKEKGVDEWRRSPQRKSSTAINHEDSWPGSLSTSPVEEWMAAGAWHRRSSHAWLLFSRLPCLFGHLLLPCLQPSHCFTLRQHVGELYARAALTQHISCPVPLHHQILFMSFLFRRKGSLTFILKRWFTKRAKMIKQANVVI